jgi:hypothetical protein
LGCGSWASIGGVKTIRTSAATLRSRSRILRAAICQTRHTAQEIANVFRKATAFRHSLAASARKTRSVDRETYVFSIAEFDVMNNGIAPEQAIDNAFKRAEAIFAKYQIVQG